METLLFGLHCLDRAVFAECGAEYRAEFMNHAFETAYSALSAVLPDEHRARFLKWFKDECQDRQEEYGQMKLIPEEGGGLCSVLSWEYAKRICIAAGEENPVALKVMSDGASEILSMMMKIAKTI